MADISEQTLIRRMNEYNIPERMRGGLMRWIISGIPPGDFLTAVLKNDLSDTFERADDENMKLIHNYLKFLYNCVPFTCWGSIEQFDNWKKSFIRNSKINIRIVDEELED